MAGLPQGDPAGAAPNGLLACCVGACCELRTLSANGLGPASPRRSSLGLPPMGWEEGEVVAAAGGAAAVAAAPAPGELKGLVEGAEEFGGGLVGEPALPCRACSCNTHNTYGHIQQQHWPANGSNIQDLKSLKLFRFKSC